MLKIGIVCYPSIGGSGIVATNLGMELARRGHQIHFISYDEPFLLDARHKNIRFHKVPINEYKLFKYPDYTLPLAVQIEQVQRKHKLDLIHVHYAVPHATAALLARRIMRQNNTLLPKIVTTLHGTDITLLARDKSLYDIIKYSIERSHGVTAVSESLRQETIKILKPEHDIEVIYNFYTPEPVTRTRMQVRAALKVKDSDFLAIHISNLRPVKRIPDLLKILTRFKNNPRFKLLILAGDDFSPYWKLATKLGVRHKLIVKNNVKNVGNYIGAADFGLYTSETESFGMAALETMGYGRPVVTTNTGGIPELVTDYVNGFMVKVGNINAFAKQLKLLMADTWLRKKMGQMAKKIACENFCADKIVPQYLEYYKKIINN